MRVILIVLRAIAVNRREVISIRTDAVRRMGTGSRARKRRKEVLISMQGLTGKTR